MPFVGAVTSNVYFVSKDVNYNANPSDFVVMDATNGPRTITLPAAPLPVNTVVAVKKTDTTSNVVTVQAPQGSGKTIDGDPNLLLTGTEAAATLVYDGANWAGPVHCRHELCYRLRVSR